MYQMHKKCVVLNTSNLLACLCCEASFTIIVYMAGCGTLTPVLEIKYLKQEN